MDCTVARCMFLHYTDYVVFVGLLVTVCPFLNLLTKTGRHCALVEVNGINYSYLFDQHE